MRRDRKALWIARRCRRRKVFNSTPTRVVALPVGPANVPAQLRRMSGSRALDSTSWRHLLEKESVSTARRISPSARAATRKPLRLCRAGHGRLIRKTALHR